VNHKEFLRRNWRDGRLGWFPEEQRHIFEHPMSPVALRFVKTVRLFGGRVEGPPYVYEEQVEMVGGGTQNRCIVKAFIPNFDGVTKEEQDQPWKDQGRRNV
jgi:hypothetical protein